MADFSQKAGRITTFHILKQDRKHQRSQLRLHSKWKKTILIIPLLAWAMSENRTAMASAAGLRFVVGGIALQFLLVVLLLHMPWTRTLFEVLASGVVALQAAADKGATLVFGYLASGPAPSP